MSTNIDNYNEHAYINIILPNTKELLNKVYSIIYLIKKKLIKKKVCNNEIITVIYKIINNYYNKIDNEYNNLKKDKNFNKYMKIYEDAKLFLNTFKNIIVILDKKYFYIDLYDIYYYYYYMVNNDVNSEIYERNYKLLELLFNYTNSKDNINKKLVDDLNKLEVNSYYYDLVYNYINNINIDVNKILQNYEIRNDLVKSNIILQQSKKINNKEIIDNKQKLLKERSKEKKDCNLELKLKDTIINKENNLLFKKIVFETKNDINELNMIKLAINNNEENDKNNNKDNNDDDNDDDKIDDNDNDNDNDEDDDIQKFKNELIKTFENNNNEFEYNKENRNLIKNRFSNYYDNGGIHIINNYNNNAIASLFINYISNNKKLNINDNDRYSIINYNEKNEIIYGIDFGTLRKNFIQSLINELFEKKIFINDERENNNKYFLNSNYKPDENFLELLKNNNKKYYDIIKNNDKEFINDFYKFLSNLITFLLFSNFNIEKELSSFLLANYYKNNFTDYDYVYYLFKDFDFHLKSEILKFLNIDVEELNTIPFEFNNEYLLDKNQDKINSSNNIEYIIKLSKFLSSKTIEKTKNLEVINRGELINKTFIESIPAEIKSEFNNINNINNSVISKLLNNNELNYDEFKESFYNNVIFSTIQIKDENVVERVLKQKKIIILANFIKSFFISNLYELYKNINNFKFNININKNFKKDDIPKYYPNLNYIDFPDYFSDNTDDQINIILNDIIGITEENINNIQEKYKSLINKIQKTFNSINPKNKEIKGGNKDKKKYQSSNLFIHNKHYFIIYNNKNYYLTINNIIKRNNKLYMKIKNKLILIIF